MTADDLYEHMKQALAFFGLRWGGFASVQVTIRANKLVLSYEGKDVTILRPESN